jgi:hypothetical protein
MTSTHAPATGGRTHRPPGLDDLCRVIAREDRCKLAAAEVEALLLRRSPGALSDWDEFRASWSRMPLDGYMADGGRYRRRRYAVLSAEPSSDGFAVEPHQPHYQSLSYNSLNGGVPRHFEPIEEVILTGPTMSGLIGLGCELFGRLSPYSHWHIEAHQFRIEPRADAFGKPTPEGTHRDGRDFVLMALIDRVNIVGGVTTIYDLEGEPLDEFTLTEPLDLAITNDERVLHGVTPIAPKDPTRPSHRDVLVATFRHRRSARG